MTDQSRYFACLKIEQDMHNDIFRGYWEMTLEFVDHFLVATHKTDLKLIALIEFASNRLLFNLYLILCSIT